MTVCVAIKVRDCIVFAADSATAAINPAGAVENIWQHGIKVFNLYRELPIVGMTAGMGNFGRESISTLAKDLRLQLMAEGSPDSLDRNTYTINEVVQFSSNYFFQKYQQIQPPPADSSVFSFWIGGYGADDMQGSIWNFSIANQSLVGPIEIATETDDDKVAWGGQGQAIQRLIFGFDDNLQSHLVAHGATQQDAQQILDGLRQGAQTPMVNPTMPVQDAINLADFLVDVSKQYSKFLPGPTTVGGSTDIATVTVHEGFKWIKRKHYYPLSLNRLETDHAA